MASKKTVPAKEVQILDDNVTEYTIEMLRALVDQSQNARQPMLTYLLSMALIEACRLGAEMPAPPYRAACHSTELR